MRASWCVVAVILSLAWPAPASAQGQAARQSWTGHGAFVVRLGTDTTAVERFRRGAGRVEGEVVTRSPRTTWRSYTVELDREGGVTRVTVAQRRPGASADAAPQQTTVASFANDSVTVEVRRDTAVQRRQLAAPRGTIPLFAGSYLPYELMLHARRHLRTPQDSVAVPTYPLGSAQIWSTVIRRAPRDSVVISNAFGTYRARVDRNGSLLGWTPTHGTQQVSLERLERLDVSAVAAAWTARDQQGQSLGQLSPRDTTRAAVAGANLLVDYGRPSKRGRVIFGGVVPWNEVWRTGANQATHFVTDRDLVMGGVTVPAGTYTLWTLPSPSGWKLIVNRQTGQWGTVYSAEQDLARLDMQVSSLGEVVERFAIRIEPSGQGGSLVLEWDTVRAAMPFTVR
jgi:hypothetical protein